MGSGIFHVYSGGIVIDTLKTRLQNGQTLRQALLVTGRQSTTASALVRRYARRQGAGNGSGWLAMVRRSNLSAGHLITAAGRFPYLFLNLGTYSQAEQWCLFCLSVLPVSVCPACGSLCLCGSVVLCLCACL